MQFYNNYTPSQWIKNLAQTLGISQHTLERQLPEHHGGPLNNRIPVVLVTVGTPQNMEEARGVFVAEKLNILWGPERPSNSDKRVQKTQQLLEHLDYSRLQYSLWEVQRPVDSLRAIWGNRPLHPVVMNDQRTWPPTWTTRMPLPWQKEPMLNVQLPLQRENRDSVQAALLPQLSTPCTMSAGGIPAFPSRQWDLTSPAPRTPIGPMTHQAQQQSTPSYQAELRQSPAPQYTAPLVQQQPPQLAPLPPFPMTASSSPVFSPFPATQTPQPRRMQAGLEATPSGLMLTFPEGRLEIPMPNGSNFLDIAQILHTLHKWLMQPSRME